MTMLGMASPRRFSTLVAADARNVSRDPTLVFAFLMGLAPAILLRMFGEALDGAGLSTFGIAGLSAIAAPLALVLPAMLIGWVTGFLFLEDRDEGTLMAIDVTPAGKGGFMAYRMAITIVATGVVTLFGCWLLVPEQGVTMAMLVAVLASIEAICAAFILPAVARNKVEGLAATKLTNLAALAPLLALIPSPLRYAAGILPPFWLGEILTPAEGGLPLPVVVVLALLVHLVVAGLLYRLVLRRMG